MRHYRATGRHALPWRKTQNPYRILVSEIMLQQTQVDRVIPFYRTFLKKFPTVRALAGAPLSDVLRAWQGLGYNRRAKFLRNAAKEIAARHGGAVPRGYRELVALPGVGAYTASAVRAFAWNEPDVFMETNIRTAILQRFFPHTHNVHDRELCVYVAKTLQREKHPREWYFALMDYGAHLKKTNGNASRRSAHYAKQKPFKGSDREIRGAILKILARGASSRRGLFRALPFPEARAERQLAALTRDGLVSADAGRYRLG